MSLVTRGLGRLKLYVGRGLGPRVPTGPFVPIGHAPLTVAGVNDRASTSILVAAAARGDYDSRVAATIGDTATQAAHDRNVDREHGGDIVGPDDRNTIT